MALKAHVKLKWLKSASAVETRQIVYTVDGFETTVDLTADAAEYVLDLAASTVLTFHTVVTVAGIATASATFSQTLGDLVAPLPDTGLAFEILGVFDDTVTPTPVPVPVPTV